MKRRFLVVLGCAALVGGCWPVPRTESKSRSMWNGFNTDGSTVAIVEEQRTKYVQILASPEGSAKMRRHQSACQYFIGSKASPEGGREWLRLSELPWLTIEEDPAFYTWHKILRLEGTEYWAAFRRVSSDERGPRSGTFEIVVFDRKALKSRKMVERRDWPGVEWDDEKYLADLSYDRDRHSIAYDSPSGPKRYRLVEGKDEEPNQ